MNAPSVKEVFALFSGSPPDVSISFCDTEQELAEVFAETMQSFVNVRFSGKPRKSGSGDLDLAIYGEPLFLRDGRVVFR